MARSTTCPRDAAISVCAASALSCCQIAEVQATAEGATYDEEALLRLLRLARIGCDRIFAAKGEAVGK